MRSASRRASRAVKDGYSLLILSDRGIDKDYAPIPSLRTAYCDTRTECWRV